MKQLKQFHDYRLCKKTFDLAFKKKLSGTWAIAEAVMLNPPDSPNSKKLVSSKKARAETSMWKLFGVFRDKIDIIIIGKSRNDGKNKNTMPDFIWTGDESRRDLQRQFRASLSLDALRKAGFEKWKFAGLTGCLEMPQNCSCMELVEIEIGKAVIEEVKRNSRRGKRTFFTLGYNGEELLSTGSVEELMVKTDLEESTL